jgi:hypothetical protein
MRVRRYRPAIVTGIAALVLIPGCRGDLLNIASVSGLCIPSMSVTSVGTPASVGEGQTCPPGGSDAFDTESASAGASAGSLEVSGRGLAFDAGTSVQTFASYSEEIVVTGPESGSGALLLSFETSFGGGFATGSLNVQFASSGSGGESWQCSGGGPPCLVPPTVVDFAIPFTYGVPFTYTISLSALGRSGDSFQFMDSATLTEIEAGPLDTISSVPEPANVGLMLVGLTVLVTIRRVFAAR